MTLSDACQGLLVSGSVLEPAAQALVGALGIALVFAPLSVWAFRRRG